MQSDAICFFILSFPSPPFSEQTPEMIGAPGDLLTSEVTARSFRVTWSHAPGNVEKYRVVYYPSQGGEPQEVNYVFSPSLVIKRRGIKQQLQSIHL